MQTNFSFIIPVYNRPQEIKELLESIKNVVFDEAFEVVIIEDGSTLTSEEIVAEFSPFLKLKYLKKENSGPGDSRNFGMQKAVGNYFLILDSDVVLPPEYLIEVKRELERDFVNCFGGPDAAHQDFSDIQKAINYSMTSFLTTGGIRGGKKMLDKFQPRSFNMGLSKKAFEATGGFGRIHPGEDPDLALRLQKSGYTTKFFPKAYVYHKRRIDWKKFYAQVNKFGKVRPILNLWHPSSAKLTFWFPSVFTLGFLIALILALFGFPYPLYFFGIYLVLVFLDSFRNNNDLKVAALSVWAVLVQFYGYGLGYCKSTCYLRILNKDPEKAFPELFFRDVQKT